MKTGVTLVEMIAALAVSSILVLAVGSSVAFGTRMTLDARGPVELKREATLAFKTIQKRVRVLSVDTIQINDDGDKLTIVDGSETPPYFQGVGADLIYFNGTVELTLIAEKLDGVAFTAYQGYRPDHYVLLVSLQLSDGDWSVDMDSMTMLRNR